MQSFLLSASMWQKKLALFIVFVCSTLCIAAQVAIVAHRGYWNCEAAGFARNSLASLKAAQDAGFWGSEFDVNMTNDSVLKRGV